MSSSFPVCFRHTVYSWFSPLNINICLWVDWHYPDGSRHSRRAVGWSCWSPRGKGRGRHARAGAGWIARTAPASAAWTDGPWSRSSMTPANRCCSLQCNASDVKTYTGTYSLDCKHLNWSELIRWSHMEDECRLKNNPFIHLKNINCE